MRPGSLYYSGEAGDVVMRRGGGVQGGGACVGRGCCGQGGVQS
jgi:hypothetical protein